MFIDKSIKNNTNSKLQDQYLQECGRQDLGHKNLHTYLLKYSKQYAPALRFYTNLFTIATSNIVQMVIVYTRRSK